MHLLFYNLNSVYIYLIQLYITRKGEKKPLKYVFFLTFNLCRRCLKFGMYRRTLFWLGTMPLQAKTSIRPVHEIKNLALELADVVCLQIKLTSEA